ncbi:hypothetical protein M3D15_08675 [Pseudoclavibacter alba]|uniref:HK97 gp10 family phage protein n=1 Tax=Pseudoclavibacter albus TaxID=272241 RepID=A0ABT2HYK9_9MICO|nr:hypothetical protein [Pseudoclavibacter alba]MCT2043397.1 hypothetical protein [Pseudoclavibacter alba]
MGTYDKLGTIRIEGTRQLRRSLRAAGDDLSDLKEAHREAAAIAAEASADLAPKKSGKLAESIRSAGTKTFGEVRAGKKAVPYANPIHWGWFKRGIKPQPFASRGAQDSEGRWIRVYDTALENAIKKVEGA